MGVVSSSKTHILWHKGSMNEYENDVNHTSWHSQTPELFIQLFIPNRVQRYACWSWAKENWSCSPGSVVQHLIRTLSVGFSLIVTLLICVWPQQIKSEFMHCLIFSCILHRRTTIFYYWLPNSSTRSISQWSAVLMGTTTITIQPLLP